MKCIALVLFMMCVVAAPAAADIYGFYNITNNDPTDAAIGEAQLTVNVTDAGGDQVLFTFANAGPEDSSITRVYFDDGSLGGIAAIINGTGVSFSEGGAPPVLPGGGPYDFELTVWATANEPVQPNGVNPGESLDILFDLATGQTFADVISELNSQALRIGIHVQGFASGGSESFINVPLPGALLLGMLGLVAAGRKLRNMC